MAIALVTGGAGFIGSHLVRALIQEGFQVRVVDNFSTGHMDNLEEVKHRIELFDVDIRRFESLKEVFNEVKTVFHLAALPSVPRSMKDPATTTEVNVDGTVHVLEASRRAGVKRVVYASSSSIYGENLDPIRREGALLRPASPYALSKWVGEQYCFLYTRLFGLETVALRYFNVFGPRQDPESPYAAVVPKFILTLQNGKSPVIYGDGEQTRDFTFVENVVQANLLAAQGKGVEGRAFNIGCGLSLTVNALYRQIRELLECHTQPSYEPARAGDVRYSQADIALACEQLGYVPVIDVQEGLRRTLAWYYSRNGNGRSPHPSASAALARG